MRDISEEHAIYKKALEDMVAWKIEPSLSAGYMGYNRGILHAREHAHRALVAGRMLSERK